MAFILQNIADILRQIVVAPAGHDGNLCQFFLEKLNSRQFIFQKTGIFQENIFGYFPLLFPVLMQLFGLLTGVVQAYIFAVLAAVYMAAGMEVHEHKTT